MAQNWMIDVLTDLRRFARDNKMPVLTEQLDDTILVAAAELSQAAHGGPVSQDGCETSDRVGVLGERVEPFRASEQHSRAS